MKDFFDVHFLSTRHSFDLATLSEPLRRTLERRGTALPANPRTRLATDASLAQIAQQLRSFLGPALAIARHAGTEGSSTWTPPGPWEPE